MLRPRWPDSNQLTLCLPLLLKNSFFESSLARISGRGKPLEKKVVWGGSEAFKEYMEEQVREQPAAPLPAPVETETQICRRLRKSLRAHRGWERTLCPRSGVMVGSAHRRQCDLCQIQTLNRVFYPRYTLVGGSHALDPSMQRYIRNGWSSKYDGG